MAPVTNKQVATFIPLLVALIYVLRGIWNGPRHIVAGIAIAALTLVGFVWLSSHSFSGWRPSRRRVDPRGLWMRQV